MDKKAGKWSVAYAKFAKWVSDGTMARLVKCLAQLGLTKDWNRFLVAPLSEGQKSLKMIIGAEAWLHEGEGRTRYRPKVSKAKETTKKAEAGKSKGKADKTTKAKTSKAKTAKPKTKKAAKEAKPLTTRTRKPKAKAARAKAPRRLPRRGRHREPERPPRARRRDDVPAPWN